MDIDKYIKKSRVGHSRFETKRERYCLECNQRMEDDGSHLFLQSFCSEGCKQKYLDSQK